MVGIKTVEILQMTEMMKITFDVEMKTWSDENYLWCWKTWDENYLWCWHKNLKRWKLLLVLNKLEEMKITFGVEIKTWRDESYLWCWINLTRWKLPLVLK